MKTPKLGALNNLSSIMFDRLPDAIARCPGVEITARSRLRSSRNLETAKGCHKVFDFAVRRGFAGFEVPLNA
jgi:hypothetical protein